MIDRPRYPYEEPGSPPREGADFTLTQQLILLAGRRIESLAGRRPQPPVPAAGDRVAGDSGATNYSQRVKITLMHKQITFDASPLQRLNTSGLRARFLIEDREEMRACVCRIYVYMYIYTYVCVNSSSSKHNNF